MIKRDIQTALRHLFRRKSFGLINIGGLAIGMACCTILFLFVQYESGFDRFHAKADRIARVISQDEDKTGVDRFVFTPAPLAPALAREFPEVEGYVRFANAGCEVSRRGQKFSEQVYFADSNIFEIFDFFLDEGDPRTALRDPRALVLSRKMAEKYFPGENPIGQTLTLFGDRDYRITGILREIPANSHLRFEFLGSFAPFAARNQDQWGISNYYTYLLLAENASLDALSAKIPGFIDKYRGRESREKYKLQYLFQPLTSIHLTSHWRGEIAAGTKVSSLYIFSAVGLFILLLACFNYINLSTARYTARAPEVAVRKVVGAGRAHLIRQFLSESLLHAVLALPLAAVLVEAILPRFNALSGRPLVPDYLRNWPLLAFAGGVVLFAGLVSGLYPALFVSGIQPVRILRGTFRAGLSVSVFRKALVVAQFTISIGFIVCALLIAGQIRFLRTTDIGLDKDRVVMIPIHEERLRARAETVKAEFLRLPGVAAVSASSYSPAAGTFRQNYWKEGDPQDSYPMIRWISVDRDFLQTMGIDLLQGRDFPREGGDAANQGYILNEAAVQEFGWTDPVGKAFKLGAPGTIIGVVKDFNFSSLHMGVEPLVLNMYPEGYQYFIVRLRPGNTAAALEALGRTWSGLAERQPFEFQFLDEQFGELYQSEIRVGKTFGGISALSVFIACLGLFGMASYAVERRTKEIGIRRVLGSPVARLAWVLSREFVAWVLLANVLAWPAAYLIMKTWLSGFAYRIPVGPGNFLLAGGMALALALLTVSFRAFKTASLDPVRCLRYE